MQTLKDSWQIAKKDLLEFARDHLRLITFFIMPMFMMIMTGYIFPNQNTLKNIPIGVSNQDNQEISQKLIQTISDLKLSGDTPAFKLNQYNNIDEIKDAIKKQQISGGISITEDFSKKISQNEQTEVTVIEDQSNPQVSQMVNQVLTKIIEGFSQQLGVQKINQILVQQVAAATPAKQASQPSLTQQIQTSALSLMVPITTKIEGLIPGNPSYFEFVAPGIMAMVVMTAVLTGLAASISREKEQGTLDGILISPISRLAVVLGKALSQSIRGLVQGAIVLLLTYILFGVTVHGSLWLVALLLLLGIFSFVGLGILVSAIAAEQETATQLLFMFQFPMLFLSGVFFPILMMPSIMQKIAYVIPLTYAINALRQVVVLGAGLGAIRSEVLILVLFGVVTLSIAVPVFQRVITK